MVSYPCNYLHTKYSTDMKMNYQNMKECIMETNKLHAMRGFYRGFGYSIARWSIIGLGAMFPCCMTLYMKWDADIIPPAVTIATLTGRAMTYPLYTLRSRMIFTHCQDLNSIYNSMGSISLIKSIIKQEGVKGLYGGFSVEILKIPVISYLVYLAMLFGLKEMKKDGHFLMMTQQQEQRQLL